MNSVCSFQMSSKINIFHVRASRVSYVFPVVRREAGGDGGLLLVSRRRPAAAE